jgi:hypothetical protein
MGTTRNRLLRTGVAVPLGLALLLAGPPSSSFLLPWPPLRVTVA